MNDEPLARLSPGSPELHSSAMAEPTTVGDDIAELTPALPTAWVGVVIGTGTFASFQLLVASSEVRATCFPMLALLVLLAVVVSARTRRPRRTPVHLSLDGDTLVIARANGRTRRVPRSQIDRIEVTVPDEGGPEVVLFQRWRTVRLAVASRALGHELVRRLGLQRRTTTYWAFSPFSESHLREGIAILTPMVATAATIMAVGHLVPSRLGHVLETTALHVLELTKPLDPSLGLPAFLLLALLAFTPLALPTLLVWAYLSSPTKRVTLAHDGIEVRWMGRSRYVPFHQIEETLAFGTLPGSQRSAVELRLRDGATVRLPMSRSTTFALADALRASTTRKAATEAPLVLPERGGGSLADWVAQLRRTDSAGLRDQAISKDDLWRVVEDANAAPIDRATAAVALGTTLSARDRVRLADIAETVAAPKLRVVLEHSPDADDEALAAMLDAVEHARQV